MGKATKAVDSPYYQARIRAAECNDDFASREATADVVGVERTRLARIELGTLTPYPEEVLMMAEAYNAPELCNYHCTHDCPIGRITVAHAELRSIEQIAVRCYGTLRNAESIKESLISIAADGVIDEAERPQLVEILRKLSEINQVAAELSILARRLGIGKE